MFLALQKSRSEYSTKLASSATDKTLFSLGWKVDELSRLYDDGRKITVMITILIESLSDDKSTSNSNVPYHICMLKRSLCTFLKSIVI